MKRPPNRPRVVLGKKTAPKINHNKYTFVHIPKTGGWAIRKYFDKHYSDYIIDMSHKKRCSNHNNSIIVIRDVKSRFLSMYKYWKNGTIDREQTTRNPDFKEKHKDITILDFINILKTDKKYLTHGFTWDDHFDIATKWIGDTDYKNIIVIKYKEDLNESVQKLINFLGIVNKNIPLAKANISVPIKDELINHPDVDEFIKEYFKDDIILIDTIEHTPEVFKVVI